MSCIALLVGARSSQGGRLEVAVIVTLIESVVYEGNVYVAHHDVTPNYAQSQLFNCLYLVSCYNRLMSNDIYKWRRIRRRGGGGGEV